jgi:hypothetical protein
MMTMMVCGVCAAPHTAIREAMLDVHSTTWGPDVVQGMHPWRALHPGTCPPPPTLILPLHPRPLSSQSFFPFGIFLYDNLFILSVSFSLCFIILTIHRALVKVWRREQMVMARKRTRRGRH